MESYNVNVEHRSRAEKNAIVATLIWIRNQAHETQNYRKIYRRILIIAFALISLSLALANSAHSNPKCNDSSNQMEMNACASVTLNTETKRINSLYNELRLKLSPKDRMKIRDIQLAWIKFRDLSCELESSGVEGGSVHSMIFSMCLTRYTRQRIEELERLNTCVEGDLSCPF